MNTALDEFLRKVKDLHSKSKREMLALFGYYLAAEKNQPAIKPSELARCFDDAAIPGFANVYVEMERSGLFVKTKYGWQLKRETREKIAQDLSGVDSNNKPLQTISSSGTISQSSRAESHDAQRDKHIERNVFVVYGRDKKLNDAMFNFLRSLRINPIEWTEAAKATGDASPTNLQIVEAGFAIAQAALVMFTPDEVCSLREDLRQNDAESNDVWQSRPNVYFEAGIAMTLFAKRTVLVEVGAVREVTDLSGRNAIRISAGPEWRVALAERLKTAGCDVTQSGTHWLSVGDFGVSLATKKRKK